MLAENVVSAAMSGAGVGHLPWPIAQWALTTPLGTLVVALVGGLVSGVAAVLATRIQVGLAYPVDVTELPLVAWPAHALPPWRRPGGPTLAEYRLGRGWRQRILSLFALALTVLLLLVFFVTIIAVFWYGITHIPNCTGSRCPPTFDQIRVPLVFLGLTIMFLGQYAWVRYVERRCGIWFRMPNGAVTGFTCYIRRQGVTAEAAGAALAHYTQGAGRPAAWRRLEIVLCFVPFFLVQIALALLAVWLPTQWIPA